MDEKTFIESFVYKECGKDLDLKGRKRKSFSLFDFEEKKESSSVNLENTKKYQEALTSELEEWDTLLYNAKDNFEKAKDVRTVVKKDILSHKHIQYLQQNPVQKYLDGLVEFNLEVQKFLEQFSETVRTRNNLKMLLAQKLRHNSCDLLQNYIYGKPTN